MPLFWLSFVLVVEVRSAGPGGSLETAARASPRPRDCGGAIAEQDGLWMRARAGDAQRYCDLLARGYARLRETPADALAAAEAARAISDRAAPARVLAGRAKLRLGRIPEALEDFTTAETEQSSVFLDPKALHDYARAASIAGKPAEAIRLYRRLVSQSALLDDARERSVAQIEAAAELLAYTRDGKEEALGYLAQARRQSLGLAPWSRALRLLANERSGGNERSPSANPLPSVASLSQPLSKPEDESPVLPPGEMAALSASLTEALDPERARRYWERFLNDARPENLWREYAQKRRAELAAAKGKAR